MKSLVLITDVDFWKDGTGHRVRISKLIEFLASKVNLTVVLIGDFDLGNTNFQVRLTDFTFVHLKGENPSKELIDRVRFYFLNHTFDISIIEYIHNAYFLKYITPNTISVLDIHDIANERRKSFKQYNNENKTPNISAEKEHKIFDCFDYIMVMCNTDLISLAKYITPEKLILCPHSPLLCKQEIRKLAVNIGFVSSEYVPNIDGIKFFIKYCWPLIKTDTLHMNIYGGICKHLAYVERYPNILLMGYLPDVNRIYSNIDIVINPVRYGAGLKIKNVEALANGLPLITTTHSARGLADGSNKAFLIADTPSQFANRIITLSDNYKLRKRIGAEGFKFASKYFSQDKCYQPLLNII